ncbi:prolipoprotein diacylglyceryl transferase [Janibacter hoylei]|uniref:prolipoprotein diacylglyceryl transferase n=1 Tax=Janibacter hoylei TaxID=364298 RepID=UPI002238F8F1|nr:prolipoprotein diacylglyceryl transferase [Janibacter hoylei]MCW4600582.1 prolipoprotein diacylglyceryl transferase [Janibacter hoylei]
MIPATLPSPTVGVIELGPLTLHAYALCILAGIAAAIWIGDRRMRDRGGEPGLVLDVAMWAVPFGIVGGRLYHVITTPQPYFGDGGHPVDALKIWQGGLGIWGAIALGALGAWLGLRKEGVGFLTFADAVAPGVVVAQAIGRWGNWFNNEIHGEETDLPWALEIHRWDSSAGRAVVDAAGEPVVLGTFHPTFLYESLFLLALAILLLVVDRRRRLAPGQVLGLYVTGYPVGRIIIEMMRTDAANTILGLRVNIWTSIVVFVLGVVIYVVCGRRDDRGSETKVSDSEKSTLTR